MDITEHVKEFRTLQKSQKIRVADFCRERMLDYYEMVEALKKDKFLSELPEEHVVAAELEVTDLPLEHPDPKSISFIQEFCKWQTYSCTCPHPMFIVSCF